MLEDVRGQEAIFQVVDAVETKLTEEQIIGTHTCDQQEQDLCSGTASKPRK